MSTRTRGIVFLLSAILLWSTAEIVTRTIHTQVAPVSLAWTRFTLGGVLLSLLLRWDLNRRNLTLNRTIVFHAAWMSIPGIVLASIAYQYALTCAGASVVATVFGATPIIVFLMSRLLLGDPLTWNRFLGVVFGFLGILVLAQSEPSPTYSLRGVLLTLLNASSFGLFTVLVKKYAGRHAGLPITSLSMLFGSAWLYPFMVWEAHAFYPSIPHAAWAAVLYLSLGTTGVAYLLYFLGLEHVDATQAISVILLKPPFAACLAALLLGEPLTLRLLAALALILGGLYLVYRLAPRTTEENTARRHTRGESDGPCIVACTGEDSEKKIAS